MTQEITASQQVAIDQALLIIEQSEKINKLEDRLKDAQEVNKHLKADVLWWFDRVSALLKEKYYE